MKRLYPLLILSLLGACENTVNTTSGADYLTARGAIADTEIAQIVAVEPDLHFPARIGIARMVRYDLTTPSTAEAALFQSMQQDHAALGSFTLLSPLLTAPAAGYSRRDMIRTAQLTAARQHLDYVMVYVLERSGRRMSATGVGNVAFVDVRNGYIYGAASTRINVAGLGRGNQGRFSLSDRAALKVTTALVPEISEMLSNLAAAAQ